MRYLASILLACAVSVYAASALGQFAEDVVPKDVIETPDATQIVLDVPKGITTTAVAEDLYVTTPTGTPPNPDVSAKELVDQGKQMVSAFKDGKVLAGIGILLSLLMTLTLKLIALAMKSPKFMAAKWFRNAVPITTFALSTILVLFLAFAMKLPIEDMITAILGVATGAIAWWETVGQHLFKKPSQLAGTSNENTGTTP